MTDERDGSAERRGGRRRRAWADAARSPATSRTRPAARPRATTRAAQSEPASPPIAEPDIPPSPLADTLPHLRAGLDALGIHLDERQVDLLARYRSTLIEWNERFNLTGVAEPTAIETRHFLDSLSALSVIPADATSLIDVGAGAGLPGIPLAVARPDLAVTVNDSVGKKVRFMEHAIAMLALDNANAVWARAEDLGHMPEHRARYDVAAARAVAETAVLVEYLLPLVRVGGIALLWKHGDLDAELRRAAQAIRVLGGSRPEVHPVAAPGLEAGRCLVVVRKDRPTPRGYPRPAGRPKKEPL